MIDALYSFGYDTCRMDNMPSPQYIIQQTDTFALWLRKLRDFQAKAAIIRRLNRAAKGHLGDVKSVGNKIFEMRLAIGPGYRLYFLHRNHSILLLLCGGDKSSQKQDIEHAKQLADTIQ